MLLKELFTRDINRNIAGVVKVQQEDEVKQELEEYIVTSEVLSKFTDFFTAYCKSIDGINRENGVWISGFFGSGKSHLLKMLAYLLQNKTVDNKKALEYFKDKIPDSVLFSDMERATRQPQDVILFNIDTIAEGREDIGKIFKKVFDNMRGYYGKNPRVADLESSLQDRGLLEAYREKFHALAGSDWESARPDFFFVGEEICQALVQCGAMSEMEARSWFSRVDDVGEISADEFAASVKKYLDAKGKKHRVVFMVDEIGQYIDDDANMMLRLQSLAEALYTQCKGCAWVVVTSQESLDGVITRRLTNNHLDDFTRIQARFQTRLSLASVKADEVIKKRLLDKKSCAADSLRMFYSGVDAQLRNLMTFPSPGTQHMPSYQTPDEFAAVYPFVPYQFKLLQLVFNAVRESGAGGRHLAEGERSLLGATHEVLQKFADRELGFIPPFSEFFDTMQEFLDHDVRIVIDQAKLNPLLTGTIDVPVLKLLFMLKFVREMPETVENLATLMVNAVDADRLQLEKDILEALRRLESQVLIQRNNEKWEFLTNEEQQIARQIDNIQVESRDVIQKIAEQAYSTIYQDVTVLLEDNRPYGFDRYVDSVPYGRVSNDIKLELITRDSDMYIDRQRMAFQTTGKDKQLFVVLGQPHDYIDETIRALKIEKYLNNNQHRQETQFVVINQMKGMELNSRKNTAKAALESAIQTASFWYNGHNVIVKGQNAKSMLQDGIRQVAEAVYSKRALVTKHFITGADVERQAQMPRDLLGGIKTNEHAMEDMEQYQKLVEGTQQVTLQKLMDRYTSAPYGWGEMDVAGVIVQLMLADKLEVWIEGQTYHTPITAVTDRLNRRQERDRVTIRSRRLMDPSVLQKVRELIRDMTGNLPAIVNEGELYAHVKEKLNELREEANLDKGRYQAQNQFPGQQAVQNMVNRLNTLCAHNNIAGLFEAMVNNTASIRAESDAYQKVHSFFRNQAIHYNKALGILEKYERNRIYTSDAELARINSSIKSIIDLAEPYSRMQDVPMLNQQFEDRFKGLLQEAQIRLNSTLRDEVKDVVQYMLKVLQPHPAFLVPEITTAISAITDHSGSWKDGLAHLQDTIKQVAEGATGVTPEIARTLQGIAAQYIELGDALGNVTAFAEIDGVRNRSQRAKVDSFSKLDNLPQERPAQPPTGDTPPVQPPPQKPEKRIRASDLLRAGRKVENEDAVERLLADIRAKLMEALRNGDIIRFE